jgi:hypothetical protein
MEMHCIACAFGKRGWTNMHTHWRFQPSSSIFLMVDEIVLPWPKVPRRNLVHHVCCSHVITTRGALGILVGIMQLTANPFSLLYVILLMLANCMGRQVMLTSITSIISHEQVQPSLCIMANAPHVHMHKHHVFICMCITLYAPQHEHQHVHHSIVHKVIPMLWHSIICLIGA